ncbi:WG repeat-containing protein [Chitinophaga sp. 212800010-3]|uniref:WG repeat-containing protein n=1 Tax=unclassified Chitinophaga TaxID=2619133 RepID=UPI002E1546F1
MMKFVKPIAILALTVCCSYACKERKPSPELLEFVKQFDGKNLAEAKTLLEEQKEQVDNFLSFIGKFDKATPKSYKAGEEEVTTAFQIPVAADVAAQYTTWLQHAGIRQQFRFPGAVLELEAKPVLNGLDEPTVSTSKIYFHDGSTDTTSRAVDGTSRIPSLKVIDSIAAVAAYKYPVKVVTLKLDKEHDKIAYQGGQIRLKQLKDNFVKITFSDSLYHRYLHAEALNKDGKPLDNSSWSSGTGDDSDPSGALKKMSKVLSSFIARLDKNGYKDVKALQADIMANMPDELPFGNARNGGYAEGYFKGKIAAVNLYMKDEEKEVSTHLTLINLEPALANLVMAKDDKSGNTGFADVSGKFVIPPTFKKMDQLNSFFFHNEDYNGHYYYRLDTAEKKLVKIDYTANALGQQLAVINKTANDGKAGAMNAAGQIVLPPEYTDISYDEAGKVILANKITEDGPLMGITTICDENGHPLLPTPLFVYGGYNNGLLLVKDKAQNFSFIDNKGRKVINLPGYDKVEPFADGLASVRNKNGDYGFVDVTGKLVIPCIYKQANSFNLGIAMVTKAVGDHNEVGLINTHHEAIVPFKPSTFSNESGEGETREYSMEYGKFDAHGKKVQ